MRDIIQDRLTQDQKDQAETLVTQLEAMFEGKLSVLTEKDRREYKAINEKNKLFVNNHAGKNKNN